MFKIGDFSKLTRVSVRMLRYYDEVGLFKPAKIDDFTGYRYYSAKQISYINLVMSLRDMSFNVADIAVFMKEKSEEKLEDILKVKGEEIENNIRAEEIRLKKINSAIKDMKKERVSMSYNVTLKSLPSYKVISLRNVIPTYEAEGLLWIRLGEYIMKKNIHCNNISYSTYHDAGYKEGEVDAEVVVGVDNLMKDEDGFTFKETEAVDQAAIILVPGDYSNVAQAYNFLANWIEENGYIMIGNPRQVAIKGPCNEKRTEDYLSEIQIPVKK
ncbi:MerR family transcriptional regulator [Clostridium estertheticum]|uniref:MerR family transcriptional regulator n=1 Tax=Clostridium estertheticum TaxID=238834 RepID=UPI001C0C2F9A|nr:MerR family transcriptional regulator [Clostridium estertheticum]MBU3075408.1 MerR family transcriptional regulator [Clostridium estertheticum]MBU3165573.1 MerR family transcriptional regulator [Clostridium estertheticum]MBU3186879.1 MerR family transcriptional regulator [Clostridium estertheticum]